MGAVALPPRRDEFVAGARRGRVRCGTLRVMRDRVFDFGVRIVFVLGVFANSGHGDSDQAAKMAQRLRPILLSDDCLRSQSSRRFQQRRIRQSQQHRRGTSAGHVFRAGLSVAHRCGDKGRRPLRSSRRLQRAGHQQPGGERRVRRLCATDAHHARGISHARRACDCSRRGDHIHQQRGVLARGHPGHACADSRCGSVFIRDDRERHVLALQRCSTGPGAGPEDAAHLQSR